MKKQVINSDAGQEIQWAQRTGTEPAYAESVVVETPHCKRVFLAGLTSRDPDLDMKGQTRDVLEQIQSDLETVGGNTNDVVRVRVYVDSPNLSEENFQAIHEARSEFFDPDHYPASTLVEISNLVREGKLIEIDSEAIIPKDGWEVKAIE
jgi:enamine deaminase RidA (YjgF/YER057c/UK114 family)